MAILTKPTPATFCLYTVQGELAPHGHRKDLRNLWLLKALGALAITEEDAGDNVSRWRFPRVYLPAVSRLLRAQGVAHPSMTERQADERLDAHAKAPGAWGLNTQAEIDKAQEIKHGGFHDMRQQFNA